MLDNGDILTVPSDVWILLIIPVEFDCVPITCWSTSNVPSIFSTFNILELLSQPLLETVPVTIAFL